VQLALVEDFSLSIKELIAFSPDNLESRKISKESALTRLRLNSLQRENSRVSLIAIRIQPAIQLLFALQAVNAQLTSE
jgi:hypothetical protein